MVLPANHSLAGRTSSPEVVALKSVRGRAVTGTGSQTGIQVGSNGDCTAPHGFQSNHFGRRVIGRKNQSVFSLPAAPLRTFGTWSVWLLFSRRSAHGPLIRRQVDVPAPEEQRNSYGRGNRLCVARAESSPDSGLFLWPGPPGHKNLYVLQMRPVFGIRRLRADSCYCMQHPFTCDRVLQSER